MTSVNILPDVETKKLDSAKLVQTYTGIGLIFMVRMGARQSKKRKGGAS